MYVSLKVYVNLPYIHTYTHTYATIRTTHNIPHIPTSLYYDPFVTFYRVLPKRLDQFPDVNHRYVNCDKYNRIPVTTTEQ